MDEENIQVVVRIRPLMTSEKKAGEFAVVEANSNGREVQVKIGPLEAQSYRCNRCFSNDTTQFNFFHESGIVDLLDSSINGYRTCAFAFGQTGAGKTFTMMGTSIFKTGPNGVIAPVGINHRDRLNMGMVGRSIEYIFAKLEAMEIKKYNVKITCLEIYQEHVFDLFADEKERISLPIREHAAEGFYPEGCKMVEVTNLDMTMSLLEGAMRNRQTGGHDMNNRSSRSHCLTDIFIELPASSANISNDSYGETAGAFMSRGRISLVDLAGSERLKSTNSTGKVLQEAGFINRSLYVLGKVIAGLVRTAGDLNHKDVPYRDSKLTKLLIASLCGRSRTLLISCVSEAKGSQAETLRTLKFSMSCARIKNKPMKFLDPHEKLVIELKDEIRRLRHENKKLRSNIATAPAVTGDNDSKNRLDEADMDGSGHGISLYNPPKRAISAEDTTHLRRKPLESSRESLNFKPAAQQPQQLLQSKIRQEIHQLKSKLAVNKRTKPGRVGKTAADSAADIFSVKIPAHHVKGASSPNKSKATKDVSYFRKQLEQQLQAQRSSTPEENFENDSDGEDDCGDKSIDSSSSSTRRKMSKVQLEDVIRRRAVGPMIFKNLDRSIVPVIESQQQNQQQFSNIDSKLSQKSKLKPKMIVSKPKDLKNEDQTWSGESAGSKADERISLEDYLVGDTQESLNKKNVKVEGSSSAAVPTSQSSSTLEATTKKGKKKGKNSEDEIVPYVKPKKQISPYIAHLLQSEKPKKAKKPPSAQESSMVKKEQAWSEAEEVDKVIVAPLVLISEENSKKGKKKDSNKSQTRLRTVNQKKHVDVEEGPRSHQYVEQEDILRLLQKHENDLYSAENGRSILPDIPTTSSSSHHSEPKFSTMLPTYLPAIVEDGDSDSYSDVGSKLPAARVGGSTPRAASQEIPTLPQIHDHRPSSDGIRSGGSSRQSTQRDEVRFNSSSGCGPVISVQDIRSKLEVLEMSLAVEKLEMEDNPGSVTSDAEERFSTLEREAMSMRHELELTSSAFRPAKSTHQVIQRDEVDDYLGDVMQYKGTADEEEGYDGEDFDHSDDELKAVVAQLGSKARSNPHLATHLSRKEREINGGGEEVEIEEVKEEDHYDVDWEGDEHSPTLKTSKKTLTTTSSLELEGKHKESLGVTHQPAQSHSNQQESDRNEVKHRPHNHHDEYADEDFDE